MKKPKKTPQERTLAKVKQVIDGQIDRIKADYAKRKGVKA
jgi:hypothetical protein